MLFRKKTSQDQNNALDKIIATNPLDSILNKTTKNNPDVVPETSTSISSDYAKTSSTKTMQLINELQKIDGQIIKPFVDFNEGNLFYPFLSSVGLMQDDIPFLDNLVAEGILEKQIFEKLVVCPIHPNTYSSSVHLYCPNCHSINVEKLNLFEHKRCGYISDSKNFDFSKSFETKCPSCAKSIKNFDKEIRVPAMWFQCNECSEKFDNIDVKLHCRKYEHDFDTNSAQFVPTYCYVLKNSEYSVNSDNTKIKYEIVTMLNGFNFNTEINASVVGKSGNSHKIQLFGIHKKTRQKIIVFVINSGHPISESVINSVLVPVLDVEPRNTLLVTRSEVSDGVHAMAKKYNIDIISHQDFSQIMSHVEAFLSNTTSKGVTDEN